jgi:CBS domain-containing protein
MPSLIFPDGGGASGLGRQAESVRRRRARVTLRRGLLRILLVEFCRPSVYFMRESLEEREVKLLSGWFPSEDHILQEGGNMKITHLIAGKKVATISSRASLHDLVSSLGTHHVGALVVSEDGKKIEGIVSERDVVRAMPGHFDRFAEMRVKDIMTSEVTTATADSTVSQLMTLMTERRIRHVPIVDEKGLLLSIVSIGDVVKVYISELDQERQALASYIQQ